MGVAIRITETGAEVRESVNTPDFDGIDGWVCLSTKLGDKPEAIADALAVARKYLVLDAKDGRTPREADVDEKVAIDAAVAAEDAKVIAEDKP